MKRMHIHVGVGNLEESIQFYSALFGAEPVKRKSDYAKWMVDDPFVNFAVSTRLGHQGVDHFGIQVEREEELSELREKLEKTKVPLTGEGETVCCYARSEKSWVLDTAGIPWEAYRTMEDAETFHGQEEAAGVCCSPSETPVDPVSGENECGCRSL